MQEAVSVHAAAWRPSASASASASALRRRVAEHVRDACPAAWRWRLRGVCLARQDRPVAGQKPGRLLRGWMADSRRRPGPLETAAAALPGRARWRLRAVLEDEEDRYDEEEEEEEEEEAGGRRSVDRETDPIYTGRRRRRVRGMLLRQQQQTLAAEARGARAKMKAMEDMTEDWAVSFRRYERKLRCMEADEEGLDPTATKAALPAAPALLDGRPVGEVLPVTVAPNANLLGWDVAEAVVGVFPRLHWPRDDPSDTDPHQLHLIMFEARLAHGAPPLAQCVAGMLSDAARIRQTRGCTRVQTVPFPMQLLERASVADSALFLLVAVNVARRTMGRVLAGEATPVQADETLRRLLDAEWDVMFRTQDGIAADQDQPHASLDFLDEEVAAMPRSPGGSMYWYCVLLRNDNGHDHDHDANTEWHVTANLYDFFRVLENPGRKAGAPATVVCVERIVVRDMRIDALRAMEEPALARMLLFQCDAWLRSIDSSDLQRLAAARRGANGDDAESKAYEAMPRRTTPLYDRVSALVVTAREGALSLAFNRHLAACASLKIPRVTKQCPCYDHDDTDSHDDLLVSQICNWCQLCLLHQCTCKVGADTWSWQAVDADRMLSASSARRDALAALRAQQHVGAPQYRQHEILDLREHLMATASYRQVSGTSAQTRRHAIQQDLFIDPPPPPEAGGRGGGDGGGNNGNGDGNARHRWSNDCQHQEIEAAAAAAVGGYASPAPHRDRVLHRLRAQHRARVQRERDILQGSGYGMDAQEYRRKELPTPVLNATDWQVLDRMHDCPAEEREGTDVLPTGTVERVAPEWQAPLWHARREYDKVVRTQSEHADPERHRQKDKARARKHLSQETARRTLLEIAGTVNAGGPPIPTAALLHYIHYMAAQKVYARGDRAPLGMMDDSALLAVGILVEELVREELLAWRTRAPNQGMRSLTEASLRREVYAQLNGADLHARSMTPALLCNRLEIVFGREQLEPHTEFVGQLLRRVQARGSAAAALGEH